MKLMQKIIFIFFLCLGSFSFAQTGVTVTYYTGSDQSFTVESTGKLYFANDELYVKTNDSAIPTTIPVNIIRKITFSTTLGVAVIGDNHNNMTLYPNPSTDVIKISSDVIENLDVKIYSLTGQLVLQGNYTINQDIDISGISAGLYLVQANGLTFKFVKK